MKKFTQYQKQEFKKILRKDGCILQICERKSDNMFSYIKDKVGFITSK